MLHPSKARASDTDRIVKVVDIAAPVSRVWRALTDHREFGQWFRVALDGPFVVGQMAAGRILHPGYEHVRWEAVVERMEPERLFAFAWHPYAVQPGVDYAAEPRTIVEFRLEPAGQGTRLTITESGFDSIPDHRRLEAYRSNSEGWAVQARNIAAHAGS